MHRVGVPDLLMIFFLSQTVLDLPTKQWLESAVCGYSAGHHGYCYLQPGFVFHAFDFHIICQDCRAISPLTTQLPLDRIQMLGFLGGLHPVPWTGASFQPLFQGHLVPWPAPNPMFIQWSKPRWVTMNFDLYSRNPVWNGCGLNLPLNTSSVTYWEARNLTQMCCLEVRIFEKWLKVNKTLSVALVWWLYKRRRDLRDCSASPLCDSRSHPGIL